MCNRLFYLDALRGFAMLCVVIGHLSLFCYKDASYSSLAHIVNIFHVNLFMMISGYFIDLGKLNIYPQIRNPTKVSERCGPNRQECDFSSLD